MTQVIALAPRHLETAPVHRHMDFDRSIGAGGRSSEGAMEDSRTPKISVTRKRGASISTIDANLHGVYDQIGGSAANPMKAEATQDVICLCTPAPKIPRPRNAFILYRQHHQARVTSDNPKLSNPEISKIIGEKWKNEVEDVKETWKKLAEEEKQRHQHQYPNYRYQPRRGARAQSSWPGPSPTDDQGRCPKCNGRYIATPRTPAPPFATPPPVNLVFGSQSHPNLRRLDTTTSPQSSHDLSPVNKPPFLPQLAPARSNDDYEPLSPEMKRRRVNAGGGYHLVSGMPGDFGNRSTGDLMRMTSEPGPPSSMRSYTHLPELGSLTRSQSGPMPPPPPRPPALGAWPDQSHHVRRHSGFDESLRLPPLQTPISPSAPRHTNVDARPVHSPIAGLSSAPAQDSQPVNLQTAVMTLPFRRKLAILARVCRPVPPLGHDRSTMETRGAFIAVEGPNAELLREVGQVIENGLLACEEVALKVWEGGHDGVARRDEVPTPQSEKGMASEDDDVPPRYFQTMMLCQDQSKQIVRHITTEKPLKSGRGAEEEEGLGKGSARETGRSPLGNHSPPPATRVPVALVKEGFSLTWSDKFAATTPITDEYSPVDHWQWMASLWRGTACPDLVVYVTPSDEDEIGRRGTVEFVQQLGLILVRVPTGQSLDEGTGRRMAFEVIEWTREGSFRKEVPKNWRLD